MTMIMIPQSVLPPSMVCMRLARTILAGLGMFSSVFHWLTSSSSAAASSMFSFVIIIVVVIVIIS